MLLETFKVHIENVDNDSLVRSLVEHTKKMEKDLNYYDTVELIKAELLRRLEGTEIKNTEKKWREELNSKEVFKAILLYEQNINISKIPKLIGGDVTQKSVILAIAKKHGVKETCKLCGVVTHIAFSFNGKLSCTECGLTKK